MSETSSESPSVQIHPISPSSSLSSTDSAPHSEPTSDEQPDLGAFNAVLREWTHLQPPPRIPVQIRSATSSTTPTFQPSVAGSEHSRHTRVSGLSAISSFTRPPSSSAQPEGSTVWAQAPIASYLLSGTPSNDDDEEESYANEAEYTPNSMASTSLTVEIESETDFDESNGRVESSPYPFPSESGVSGVSMPVPLQTEETRIDSRETEHLEDEMGTSETSRDRTAMRSLGETESRLTSMQLQSQVRPTPTTISVSSAPAAPSASSLSNYASHSPPTAHNRSRNPVPPRTISDSSFTTASGSASSSNLSLVSYQISEAPSAPLIEESSSINASADSGSVASASASMGLKTQRSMPTTVSGSTASLGTQRPQQTLQALQQPQPYRPHHPPVVVSSEATALSSTGSPLPNPYSPLPMPASEPLAPLSNNRRSILQNVWRQDIVDDLGTPDQPPSETLLFDPPRERRPEFHPIVDDDEEDIKVERFTLHERNDSTKLQSATISGYTPGYHRPAPSTVAEENTHGQTYGHFQRNDRREPHNEDEVFLDDEEGIYGSRYPYTHGRTPRTFGPALTPKGLPSSTADSRSQAPTQSTTSTTNDSLVHPFGYSTQSLLQMSQQQAQQYSQLQQLPHTQQPSLVQSHSQSQYQTNQPNSNMYTIAASMPHSTNPQSLPSSYSYTPRAPVASQSSSAYIPQPNIYSSSTSQYSYPNSQTQAQPEPSRNPHGYPYSLLGFHALPATFVSPEADELPPISPPTSYIDARTTTTTTTASQIPPRAQAQEPRQASAPQDSYNASFSDDSSTVHAAGPAESEADRILLEQAVPSLGFLDGVLSYLAVERERAANIAASSSTVEADDSRDTGSGDDGEAVDGEAVEGEVMEGEEDWKQAIDNEPNQPKRKRRRKRPSRSHAAAATQAQAQVLVTGDGEAPSIPPDTTTLEGSVDRDLNAIEGSTASPKRKKKTKSTPASISASTTSSMVSLQPNGDGSQTPTKPKEKEFLVPPASLSKSASKKNKDRSTITILRRPDELLTKPKGLSDDDNSDYDGGRTPTNFDVMQSEAFRGPELVVVPINLTGKKGKRVGRREREKEKQKHDSAGAGSLKENRNTAVDDNGFEFDDDEDDNDDDGVEPQEDEDEEQGEDNDSLSNLSLLKPPRRRRDRSRRRKGRDATNIHTATGLNGAYQSTPATPGHLQPEGNVANDGDGHTTTDVGAKQSTEDDDVFQSKVNATPEKRKRSRPKRLKVARSFPDLKVDTHVGEPAAVIPAVVEDRTQLAVMKATKGRVGTAELLGSHDVLDMDRNQLQKYLIASGSGIILMNSPPEPKNQPLPDSKRGRIIALARQLRELFPEQYDDLGKIIQRIERQGAPQGGKAKKAIGSDPKEEIDAQPYASKPISIPGPKRRRSRKGGHARAGSEGGTTGGDPFDFDDEQNDDPQNADGGTGHIPDIEEEEEEIDPRGRPPKRTDVLVHVFIDHSNILIGLLSHLKRNQSYNRNILNRARSRPLPALISKATAATRASNQTDPASAFAAVKASSSRPLPIPSNGPNGDSNSSSAAQAVPVEANLIPLPSFATMSRSLPTTSVLSTYTRSRDNKAPSDDVNGQQERETNSDGYEYPAHANANKDESGAVEDSTSVGPAKNGEKKKTLRHLWHAALALILERGRPVTRRVVVTSSPLYQPMDAIERLGYELRVFIRVPDLGDGQDRERYRDKDKFGAGKSSGSSKSAQSSSSPVTTSSSSGLPLLSKKNKSIGHVRHVSGNTSTESGSGGGAGSGNASGGAANLHPYYGVTNNTTQTRVKFREQGVDELLQLKLHQALAATDEVPEGSTIVLATGDGNMGQFNEDGFLGPVRTALRRGWRVELYAWEDGLSRAWKREFGAGSEWGRRGLFRVIAMEQFAHVLVEAVEQAPH